MQQPALSPPSSPQPTSEVDTQLHGAAEDATLPRHLDAGQRTLRVSSCPADGPVEPVIPPPWAEGQADGTKGASSSTPSSPAKGDSPGAAVIQGATSPSTPVSTTSSPSPAWSPPPSTSPSPVSTLQQPPPTVPPPVVQPTVRRSGRYALAVDGAGPTDEDTMQRAMRRKAEKNLDTADFHRFLIYIKRKSSHEMWIKLKEMFGGSTSHLVGGDSEELSSPSHHEELQVASTSGRDEFSSSSTSPTCSKTREETEHSMDQDMFSNEDSRTSSSSSSGLHMCLMANGSKVSPTLTPNTSSNDESDDDDNDEEYNILVHNMAMVYASLHEEIKELEAQVLSLKKDLEKRHEGKSALDKMLSMQQSPNDKSGLGFNSNNKNKSKSKSNKKKGQDKVKDPAKLVCFKCKVEGHHVRSCPLKKKKHLSEKQQGKRPQGQGQAHARPQVEDRPLPKKNQDIVPQEKKSIKKRKGNTCYLCRVKGHFASSCLGSTLSNPIIVDDDYSLGKDKDGNVFAKFVGTQSGLKKRTIWVAKPIVTNLLGPNLVGDQQAQT
ncbi:hypothetical protein QYE76_039032 [Lolium multiflorum]|uniref:CCHC-type domain-containing protein n=2 Tax=Lolium multiflorum TaxID=4521 RepID=A0AAD8WRT9_LOLMU|nr:hypothetical protein QYE76_039032 [Lolium multiflorum]